MTTIQSNIIDTEAARAALEDGLRNFGDQARWLVREEKQASPDRSDRTRPNFSKARRECEGGKVALTTLLEQVAWLEKNPEVIPVVTVTAHYENGVQVWR